MKKRLFTRLLILLSLVCAAATTLSLAACADNGGGQGGGQDGGGNADDNTPPPVLLESDAPVEILFFHDSTSITVDYAAYGEELEPSPYSEYKLDDGDWTAALTGNRQAVFEGLTPGSTHTVYARCGAHDEYKASSEYSVEVTLNKIYYSERIETAVYDVTEKTLTVTLEDNMEVSFDNRQSWTTDGMHTYDQTGEQKFFLRYSETETHYAGTDKSFSVTVTDFAGGLGTEDNPYRIDTFEQFKALRTANYMRNRDWIRLTSDIEFDDEVWGGIEFNKEINMDGDGHRIVAPKLSAPLFYKLITVRNLTVEQAEYTSDLKQIETSAALLVSWLQYAENVFVSGKIGISSGDEQLSLARNHFVSVGGIAVFLRQPFEGDEYGMHNCRVDLSVTLPDTTALGANYCLALGGLAASVSRSSGSDLAQISSCAVNISVAGGVISYGDIGGLVGGLVATYESDSSSREAVPVAVSDCYSTGKISLKVVDAFIWSSIKSVTLMGGIVPSVCGDITRCYSTIAFDITAVVYRNGNADAQTEICIGGIVAKGSPKGMKDPEVSNVFFAGSINVKNIAEESKRGGFFINDVTLNQPAEFDKVQYCYYDSAALEVEDGAEHVSSSIFDTPVTASELRSLVWQKDNLGWDEAVWNFEDGKLPLLK